MDVVHGLALRVADVIRTAARFVMSLRAASMRAPVEYFEATPVAAPPPLLSKRSNAVQSDLHVAGPTLVGLDFLPLVSGAILDGKSSPHTSLSTSRNALPAAADMSAARSGH